MNDFDCELNRRLAALREQGLYRELRRVDSPQSPHIVIGGKPYLNFSSNDYLGLANEPLIRKSAVKAVERYGVGSGASRLVCGSLAPHHQLEEVLADFKGTEAALSFSSGYATALGTICALMGKDDVVIIDKRVHACIVDAARLCGAKLRVFVHNDLNSLETILKWATARARNPKPESPNSILIVTESVFSMDGDQAPLRDIVALKERYGAWLMVDEAHATGLYGTQGRGLSEHLGINDRIEIQMGTLGKAVGSAGGFICGSRALIDYLINRTRSFIFSTGPLPAAAAAASAGLGFIRSEAGDQRRNQLWQNWTELMSKLKTRNSKSETQRSTFRSAIIPLVIGDEATAVQTFTALMSQGIFLPAIRYPTVSRGQARLRITVTASHHREDVQKLLTALGDLKFEI